MPLSCAVRIRAFAHLICSAILRICLVILVMRVGGVKRKHRIGPQVEDRRCDMHAEAQLEVSVMRSFRMKM